MQLCCDAILVKKKAITFILILLAGTLGFPVASNSFATTSPVATNDSYKVNENSIIDIVAPGVLANDTVASGKTLTAGLVSDVKNGTLILSSNGAFVYVPNSNFHGIDSFRYVSNDGSLSSNIANVTITVNVLNHSPIARNDSYLVNENGTLSIQGHGVLANDTDPDGNTLSAVLVNTALNGILVLNQNGNFTYTPFPNFHGLDSFTYKASDGTLSSNLSTVTIMVNQINPVPNNPLLVLIQQIQNLFAKITGMEQEINNLQAKNTALESRVTQLENLAHNTNPGASVQNQTANNEDQGNNDQNDDGKKQTSNHGNDGENKNKGNHDNNGD